VNIDPLQMAFDRSNKDIDPLAAAAGSEAVSFVPRQK
jgi:hypothetical protein